MNIEDARIAIIGAGPTGLGAAWRLQELGFANWRLFEKEEYAGGLAASFRDASGFTWDIGGHIQFSHYDYFDKLMDSLLGANWLHHERESWIWMCERFIPYPLQNNIRHLPHNEMSECIAGLIQASRKGFSDQPANFEQWIFRQFGDGIARHFLIPYNNKVWAYEPRHLNYGWVGERVAKVDLERIISNIIDARDDVGWGPNNKFRFPREGGTGAIWRALARRLPGDRVIFSKRLERIYAKRKTLQFEDGSQDVYDILISTAPLDWLIQHSDLDHLKSAASELSHSSTHIFGIGLDGEPPPQLKKKCWMYFPENQTPFYRATVFSNYSPNNVPDIRCQWSLMLEVSESAHKPVDGARLTDSVVDGLVSSRLIENERDIIDTWNYRTEHGYPTPTLRRDEALKTLLPGLERAGIFSRGRFGAWKYEVSNQDHSLMQGVELVERLVHGSEELTLNQPDLVNSQYRRN